MKELQAIWFKKEYYDNKSVKEYLKKNNMKAKIKNSDKFLVAILCEKCKFVKLEKVYQKKKVMIYGTAEEVKSSEIQAVTFRKSYYSTTEARAWLKKHHLVPIKRVDETKNFYRYRIKDPKEFVSFSTKKFPNLNLVIGYH